MMRCHGGRGPGRGGRRVGRLDGRRVGRSTRCRKRWARVRQLRLRGAAGHAIGQRGGRRRRGAARRGHGSIFCGGQLL
eukprot:1952249-Pleurochrysis_carterae.AAC.1